VSALALAGVLVLLLLGSAFLARRRWWIGSELLAVSLLVGLWSGPPLKALFTWLALTGLAIMVVVFLRGLQGRPPA